MTARRVISVFAATLLMSGGLAATAVADDPGGTTAVTTVASGLDSPRGLEFGPDGGLYVATVGDGVDDGAVVRLDLRRGTTTTVVDGLPTFIDAVGDRVGAHDVTFQGRGNMYVPIGLGHDPAVRPADTSLATLLRVTPGGAHRVLADLGDHEAEENPDGGLPDSNPHSAAAVPGGVVVADAGANSLVHVANGRGDVSTLAVFPDREVISDTGPVTVQSVPNSVTVGPDGAYYVGELTGFPFVPGESRVYRVTPDGSVEVFAEGFTSIIDLTFDADGNLYVLEIVKAGLLTAFTTGDFTGALVKVTPEGERTELAEGQLFAPGGVAAGDDGALYVTTSTFFGDELGTVVRIVE